jgi:3-oxoacyl-(acyl-carrier-protein) synthase
VLVSNVGKISINAVDAGGQFSQRTLAQREMERVLERLTSPQVQLVIGSANGTFVDNAERSAIIKLLPDVTVYSLKPALGESVGASALWQVIAAAQALDSGRIAPVLHAPPTSELRLSERAHALQPGEAIVLACGLNQQVAGLRLSI